MDVTVFGITVFLQPTTNLFVPVSIIASQFPRESNTVFPESTTICSKLTHPQNVSTAIDATELGISIEVRPVQPLNPEREITELGISIEVKPVHPLNAITPMDVTLLGITVFLQPSINSLLPVSIIALQFSRESYTEFPDPTTICSNPAHPPNT